MITVKADNRRRVQLPDIKAGQVFAFSDNGDNTITLTKVKAEPKEPFPKGSLKYLCTPARNRELEQIAAGTIVSVPKDHEK